MHAIWLLDAAHVLASHGVVLASSSSSSSDNTLYLLLLGPIAAVGFYTMTFLRYRNTDKRHNYEHETASELVDLQGFDRLVKQIRDTEAKRINGDNSKSPTQRLGQGTRILHDE